MTGKRIHPNFFQAFIEAVPDPLVLADKNRVIKAVNQAACDLFGYREEEMLGRSTAMMYADYDSYREVGDRWAQRERLTKARYRARAIRKDGRPIELESVGGFVRDDAGEVQGYIAIVANVTEKIRFQSFLEELTAIGTAQELETKGRINALLRLGCASLNLPMGIVSFVRGDDYLAEFVISPAGMVAPGSRFSLGETYCCEVLKAQDVVSYCRVSETAMAQHPCYRATRLESFIGAPLHVEGELYGTVNFSSPERRGPFGKSEEAMVKLIAEWTAYELAQRALRRRIEEAKRDAELRLEERERGLSRLRADLTVAARAADLAQVSSATAHEINQPLAALANYLSAGRRVLRNGAAGQRRARDLFEKALQQAERASDIVSSLQGLAEKDAGKRERVDLLSVIEEACALTLAEPTRGDVELKLNARTELPPIQANRIQVQQVVTNLLRNAVEALHGHPNPRVEVRLEQLPDCARISVLDNGPGFASLSPDLTSSRFKSAKPGGMGIGLSICRSLVEGHGGVLRLGNGGIDGGARVSFTLPCAGNSA